MRLILSLIMPDYYVAPTGNDGNPGTSSLPVLSVTRATELAAEVDRATGTIFLAPGRYGPSEVFPILVPPAFALEGRGSTPNDCRIEFADGVSTIVVLQAGRRVRNLAVVANPPAGSVFGCHFSVGLEATVNGCELENVVVKLDESQRDDALGFSSGLWIRGADARASLLGLERSDLLVTDSDSVVTRCSATLGGINLAGEGATRVEDCIDLTNSRISVSTSTSAVVERNRLRGGGLSVSGSGSASGVGPTIRNNEVREATYEGLSCRGRGNALVEGNTIVAKWRTVSITEGASPTLRNNTFELSNPHGDTRFTLEHVLWISRHSRGQPSFEGNVFVIGRGLWPLRPMWIDGPADFGGGMRASLGMNFFRLPPGLFIDFDYPGDFSARDNFWNIVPAQFRHGPDTTVDSVGARLDPDRIRSTP